MDTLYGLLTPFGQNVVGLILLFLIMSGIYYWCRIAGQWLSQPKPLNKMSDEELRSYIKSIMRPPEVMLEHTKLHGRLGDLSFILCGTIGETIASCIISRHPGLDAEAEARIRDAAEGIAERIHPGQLARSLGNAERSDIIIELRRIADTLPPTEDAESVRFIIALLMSAEALDKYEKEQNLVS